MPSTERAGSPLPASFFARSPLEVAPELLGAVIESCTDDGTVSGTIVEVEAYLGSDDAGSHAATRGVTARNKTMYGPPGTAYVYFTYGNHFMLNLVCEHEGTAGAVLVRALEPLAGLDLMALRRRRASAYDLCSGPGKLAQALGVNASDNGSTLGEGRLRVYAGKGTAPRVVRTGRIGLSAGHEELYRFLIEGSRFVSKGRLGPPRKERAVPQDAK